MGGERAPSAARSGNGSGSDAGRFRALHEQNSLFVMPNPWDADTAKLLADLGFEALATSSAALEWTLAMPEQAYSLPHITPVQ